MFKPEGEGIQCLDCEGRIFTLGVHRTVNNFERHLNGKQHRANVTARLLQIEKLGMQDTFVPACIPTTMDFNFPPAPLAVFANKSNSSFESLRSNMNQYFVALENDAASKAVRSNMLEERMAAAEQRSLVQLEKLSDKLVVSEARREENLKHMAEELATTEERSRDRLDRIVEQSAASEERSKTRLEDLSDRLARSDRRCKDEAEDLSVRFAISENSTQARLNQMTERMKSLEQINEKQNEYIHDLESQCQLHSEELQRQREREEELRRTCLAQIELHNQEIVDRLNKSEVAHSEMIHLLEKQFAERFRPLEKAKQEQIEQIEQIERFESIVPEIFQEMQALRERLSKPVKRSVSRRASYHSRPKVRHVSRRVSIIS
jgi:hypothetical protein